MRKWLNVEVYCKYAYQVEKLEKVLRDNEFVFKVTELEDIR